MIKFLVFFGLISWVSAAVFFKGPCPDVKPVEYFNMTAATGVWYEVARYANEIEQQGDCFIDEYTENNGVIEFKGHEVMDGVVVNYEGRVDYAPNAGKSGILNFISPLIAEKQDGEALPVYIVDVVYDKYVIGFECKYDKLKDMRHDYAWIMARSPIFQGDTKLAVDNFLKNVDFIDADLFIPQHFTEETCKGSL